MGFLFVFPNKNGIRNKKTNSNQINRKNKTEQKIIIKNNFKKSDTLDLLITIHL